MYDCSFIDTSILGWLIDRHPQERGVTMYEETGGFIVHDYYDASSEKWVELLDDLREKYRDEVPPFYAIGSSQNHLPWTIMYGQSGSALGQALLARKYTHIEIRPNYEGKTGAELEQWMSDLNM